MIGSGWDDTTKPRDESAELQPLLCAICRTPSLARQSEGIVCTRCGASAGGRFGVIDGLGTCAGAVEREIRGMMNETGFAGDIDAFMVQSVDRVSTLDERLQWHPYYEMTAANVAHAFGLLTLTGRERVLEIGAEHELPFLLPFVAAGCRCYATNVYFIVGSPPAKDGITRVLGDMNRLPFADASFDIVLMSATTHHSPDLERTICELARVTKSDGRVLILNEQIDGLFKHVWNFMGRRFSRGKGRSEDIHEHEYSLDSYRALFRKHGFRIIDSLFPAYYDAKLMSGRVEDERFAPVARVVSMLWRVPAIRRLLKSHGLTLGQRLLGMQLDVILERAR